MAIDDAHQQRVREWMTDKRVRPCSACGENSWNVAGVVSERAMLPDDPDPRHGTPTTMLQVVCNHCAGIRFFAADAIGIV